MARASRLKLKHVSGVNEVLYKLKRAEDAIARRSMELLFFLTSAVHYDFIYRIVNGQVEDMFQLTPNSICYLLDLKWEKAGHDKLFMYSGKYIKNIQIINYASRVENVKTRAVSAVIGVSSDSHDLAIKLEEGFMTTVNGKTYNVPARPLWERYGIFIKRIMDAKGFSYLEDSEWLDEFNAYYKDMAAVIKDDLRTRGRKSDPFRILKMEKTTIKGLISTEYPSFGTPNDIVDIALRHKSDMTQKAWKNIVRKFNKKVKEGLFPKSIMDRIGKASGSHVSDNMVFPQSDIYLSSELD